MRRVGLRLRFSAGQLHLLASASVAAIGLALVSGAAPAEQSLPEIKVITRAPTAKVTRPRRPQPARPVRSARPGATEAPRQAAPAATSDPFTIARDKVP